MWFFCGIQAWAVLWVGTFRVVYLSLLCFETRVWVLFKSELFEIFVLFVLIYFFVLSVVFRLGGWALFELNPFLRLFFRALFFELFEFTLFWDSSLSKIRAKKPFFRYLDGNWVYFEQLDLSTIFVLELFESFIFLLICNSHAVLRYLRVFFV